MSTKWGKAVEKLYENEDFIIVNKPYDMYINSDDENEKNTVTYHIASPDSHLSTSANPIHFIQRLDYSTSGVLCIAKNKNAAARAGKFFEKRLTRKYYLAIVRGHVDFEIADIEYDVGIDPLTAHSSHRMSALVSNLSSTSCVQSRPAHTRMLALETGRYGDEKVTVLLLKPITDTSCVQSRPAHNLMLALETGRYGDEKVTVLLLKPITGRRHQLRVHCQAVGHIILGDYTYSNATDITPHRMFLHATRLMIPLPNDPIDIQTSVPFFSDPQFVSKWHSETCFYKYRNKDDFKQTCRIIDENYVIGIKYKMFKYSEK